jgi:hypothetical protein
MPTNGLSLRCLRDWTSHFGCKTKPLAAALGLVPTPLFSLYSISVDLCLLRLQLHCTSQISTGFSIHL